MDGGFDSDADRGSNKDSSARNSPSGILRKRPPSSHRRPDSGSGISMQCLEGSLINSPVERSVSEIRVRIEDSDYIGSSNNNTPHTPNTPDFAELSKKPSVRFSGDPVSSSLKISRPISQSSCVSGMTEQSHGKSANEVTRVRRVDSSVVLFFVIYVSACLKARASLKSYQRKQIFLPPFRSLSFSFRHLSSSLPLTPSLLRSPEMNVP